jgi:hypothetical protein
MILSIYFSKNYFHFNNSLFYNEYIVILTFLFVATILSVVIALFSYLLAVQKPHIKKLSTYECGFARQGLVTEKSSFDLDSKSRDADEPEPTLVIDVSARTNVNPRSMFFQEAVNAQAYWLVGDQKLPFLGLFITVPSDSPVPSQDIAPNQTLTNCFKSL